MASPENEMKKNLSDDIEPGSAKVNKITSDYNPQGGWDVWTHRYNIYGLLTYEKYFPDKNIVEDPPGSHYGMLLQKAQFLKR